MNALWADMGAAQAVKVAAAALSVAVRKSELPSPPANDNGARAIRQIRRPIRRAQTSCAL
jgi:hypothetical protein